LKTRRVSSRSNPFFIAKYPITYSQYKAFLDDAQGYAGKRWWNGLERKPKPGEQDHPIDNCPAENVSWYDAMAFCRWLTARLGYEVRLPTEMEWQQAATGGNPNNEYPWGPNWIESRANTDESRLSRTTAVGMYVGGASAHEVLDLAGNVWEWCLNKFERPNDVAMSGKERRVARGGSWAYYQALARCAFRGFLHPAFRYGNIGFRIVRVSLIR
jgi:formylglycine-generating enzyme required for sulfatase activity